MNPKAYFDNNPLMLQEGYVCVLFSVKEENSVKTHIQQAVEDLDLDYNRIYIPEHTDFEEIYRRIQIAEILIIDITCCSPEMIWLSGIALARKDEGRIIFIRDELTNTLPVLFDRHEYSYTYDPADPEKKELQEILLETMRTIQERGRAEKRQWPFSDMTLPEVLFQNAGSIHLMKSVIRAVDEQKKWGTAKVLLNRVNAEEPNNWYILLQWGVMFRNKGEFQNALDKFNEALRCVKFNQERAYVCVEIALLYQREALLCQKGARDKECETCFRVAKNWFDKAESSDKSNLHIYQKLAEFYAHYGDFRKGDFRDARIKFEVLLDQLGKAHPNYNEFQTWKEYFQRRLEHPKDRRTFNLFRKDREESLAKSPNEETIEGKGWEEYKLSHKITWEGIRTKVGDLAAGTVDNIQPYGIFVKLSLNFNGLLHNNQLPPDLRKKISQNTPLRNAPILVRIEKAKINTRRNNKKEIALSFHQI